MKIPDNLYLFPFLSRGAVLIIFGGRGCAVFQGIVFTNFSRARYQSKDVFLELVPHGLCRNLLRPIRNSSGTGYTLQRFFLGQGIVFRGKSWRRLKFLFVVGTPSYKKKSSAPRAFYVVSSLISSVLSELEY